MDGYEKAAVSIVILIWTFLVFAVAESIGESYAKDRCQREAVVAGAAQYRSDLTTGSPVFYYLDGRLPAERKGP